MNGKHEAWVFWSVWCGVGLLLLGLIALWRF